MTPIGMFITWTTYGNWLPGDARGWRHRDGGMQLPQPRLERWCRQQLADEAVLLSPHDRETVEGAIREHCEHRGWELIEFNARTNHVHVVLIASAKPSKVRDQLKANCTRELRCQESPLQAPKIWTKRGDCSVLDNDEEIQAAALYVREQQDNPRERKPQMREPTS